MPCLIVIIVALSAMITISRYSRASVRFAADTAAKRLAADLFNAQQRARGASGSRTIQFTPGSSIYRITNPTINGVGGTTTRHALPNTPIVATVDMASFAASAALSFDGNGAPGAAGSITLSSGSKQGSISIVANTGPFRSNSASCTDPDHPRTLGFARGESIHADRIDSRRGIVATNVDTTTTSNKTESAEQFLFTRTLWCPSRIRSGVSFGRANSSSLHFRTMRCAGA